MKYFLAHGPELAYLTTPFGRANFAPSATWLYIPSDKPSDKPATESGTGVPQESGGAGSPASAGQMVFNWPKPCVDRQVFSTELKKELPRTFDDNCFRGDRVKKQKSADEYRIIFLGGSTVEDAQSDEEMMTAVFKRALPPTHSRKRITVVNAGKVGLESRRIVLYWNTAVHAFSPDLVLYCEGWNEQPTDAKFQRVDRSIAAVRNGLHDALYYNSMLYTYLIEKFSFLTTSNDHFWKIDVRELRTNIPGLASAVRVGGGEFRFVTQVIRFPRMWKGVDTFDYHAADALLDRLKADRQYVYNAEEISALNQRLAIDYTIDLCRENGIPVINILDAIEALGDERRAQLFTDLGHRSVEGNAVVGALIAQRVGLSN